MLKAVLRHEGEDRSAHDVLRASLAAYEDRSLLSNLVFEARRLIDERAGGDPSGEIAALKRRADVETAARAAPRCRDRRQRSRKRTTQRDADLERVPRRPLWR